jgi:hypothetical protein
MIYRGGYLILYNSLKIRRYQKREDIRAIIDWLCREGAHVEHWLPKAYYKGYVYDLRVVVIAGRARHRVVRLSKTPMTNRLGAGGQKKHFAHPTLLHCYIA